MAQHGRFKSRTLTRLLALVAAVAVAGGITLAASSASATAPTGQWAHSYGDRTPAPGDATSTNGSGSGAGSGSSSGSSSGSASGGSSNADHDHGSSTAPTSSKDKDKPAGNSTPPAPPTGSNNGLDVLGRDCSNSKLEPHDGFQKGPRCVSTAAGEVSEAAKNPSLLITSSPESVKAGEKFSITVSTRNLVRDRFLGAAVGGYFLERSFLNEKGLQRGHFHTACRMLASTKVAPDPAPVPPAFVATQDGGGGAKPDTVTVEIAGLPTAGIAQCSTWAGDGSHRLPMMERANQTPAFDVVRITVK